MASRISFSAMFNHTTFGMALGSHVQTERLYAERSVLSAECGSTDWSQQLGAKILAAVSSL